MRKCFLSLLVLSALLYGLLLHFQGNEPVRTLGQQNWININGGSFITPADQPLSFPEDHGEHSGVQKELWQFSGMLRDSKNKNYGFQVSFFRLNIGNDLSKRQSSWATRNIYRAQWAYAPEDGNRLILKQRTSRDALGLAGYLSVPSQQKLSLYNWQVRILQPPAGQSSFILQLADNNDTLQLTLQPVKPAIEISLIAQMKFYGISRLKVEGSLQIGGQSRTVSGVAFFDHAWGNLPISGGQLVWNQFFLQMSNNQELVILQSRRRDGSGTPIQSGYLIDRNAEVVELSRKQFELKILEYWQSQKSGIQYPLSWQIIIPGKKLTLTINALIKDQEINDEFVNWSGTVKAAGEAAGTKVQGSGLLKLSGYETVPR
jgi:predicted secreted hydrolase